MFLMRKRRQICVAKVFDTAPGHPARNGSDLAARAKKQPASTRTETVQHLYSMRRDSTRRGWKLVGRRFGLNFRGCLEGLRAFGGVLKLIFKFVVAIFLLMGSNVAAEPFDRFKDCDVCPEMIELPFEQVVRIGSLSSEGAFPGFHGGAQFKFVQDQNVSLKIDEGPIQEVLIDLPIAMSATEVTYGQWMYCVRDGGCDEYVPRNWVYLDGNPEYPTKVQLTSDHPVVFVSYYNVRSYIEWLNAKLSTNRYRLPTEVEWEFAARAGTTTQYYTGESIDTEVANFSGSMTAYQYQREFPNLNDGGYPVSVFEMKAENPWGLRHMAGNVSEITMSCYRQKYEIWPLSSQWLQADILKSDCIKVQRGGYYSAGIKSMRPAYRETIHSNTLSSKYVGFRIVKEISND